MKVSYFGLVFDVSFEENRGALFSHYLTQQGKGYALVVNDLDGEPTLRQAKYWLREAFLASSRAELMYLIERRLAYQQR